MRSSAVGEDGEETSAAGQNATFLGLRGVENIVKAVAKCWGSLYAYQSVEYRYVCPDTSENSSLIRYNQSHTGIDQLGGNAVSP